jgi:hypothetical protein
VVDRAKRVLVFNRFEFLNFAKFRQTFFRRNRDLQPRGVVARGCMGRESKDVRRYQNGSVEPYSPEPIIALFKGEFTLRATAFERINSTAVSSRRPLMAAPGRAAGARSIARLVPRDRAPLAWRRGSRPMRATIVAAW